MIFMDSPMPDATIQSIKIDHETIGHILSDRKIVRVPENQRSYAWKKEHVVPRWSPQNRPVVVTSKPASWPACLDKLVIPCQPVTRQSFFR